MTTTNTYQGTITVRIPLRVESTSTVAAAELLRRIACERQGIREEHIESVFATPVLGEALQTSDNHRAWQESRALERGTVSQRERHAAGVLPEQELLELARTELFRPFALFAKRTPMNFASIAHPRNGAGIWKCLATPRASGPVRDANELINWETKHGTELTEREANTLKSINHASREAERHPWLRPPVLGIVSPEVVGVSPREHVGTCQVCSCTTYERSALVSIYWAGRTLSREYVL